MGSRLGSPKFWKLPNGDDMETMEVPSNGLYNDGRETPISLKSRTIPGAMIRS